jgi:hypothetical protein
LVGSSRSPKLHLVVFALCSALWLAADPAHASAEELGSRGNLVFSAERLFGVYFDHESVELVNGGHEKHDWTTIAIGWAPPNSALTLPRLGIDYFLTKNFTLGGSIGFFSSTLNDNTTTGFLLAFRAGYALRLGHVVSLWPRAGFTYNNYSAESRSSNSYTFALTVDVPFCFALTEGFALTLGPVLDLGFLAERYDRDATETTFGLMFGLAGWTNL